jgi:Fe-S-cluster-containing hydrogenase component 2
MGAIVISDNTAVLTHEKCIGCGLCVSVCPGESITLTRRDNPPEVPATTRDLGVKVLGEKGRLEDFLKQMKH